MLYYYLKKDTFCSVCCPSLCHANYHAPYIAPSCIELPLLPLSPLSCQQGPGKERRWGGWGQCRAFRELCPVSLSVHQASSLERYPHIHLALGTQVSRYSRASYLSCDNRISHCTKGVAMSKSASSAYWPREGWAGLGRSVLVTCNRQQKLLHRVHTDGCHVACNPEGDRKWRAPWRRQKRILSSHPGLSHNLPHPSQLHCSITGDLDICAAFPAGAKAARMKIWNLTLSGVLPGSSLRLSTHQHHWESDS